jgi:hypothetical protein
MSIRNKRVRASESPPIRGGIAGGRTVKITGSVAELREHPHVQLSDAEYQLILKESSGNPLAQNPRSTAFGLWQGLDGIRDKYCSMAGIDPDTVDPVEQIVCMRHYIENRYGTAEQALAFHRANNWY